MLFNTLINKCLITFGNKYASNEMLKIIKKNTAAYHVFIYLN